MIHRVLACFERPSLGRWVVTLAVLAAMHRSLAGEAPASNSSGSRWWSEAVETALSQTGTNRQEWVTALEQAPVAQRDGWQFLIENMPQRDLQMLSAGFLRENITLACKARDEAPWAKRIPNEVFLNDVLPYANLTERRENWRQRLYDIAAPLVKDCKTPGEAAQALNQRLFGLVKVRYSTTRRRPDQAPSETMETGVATCTGLSILLVDACRAVGVPARVAGTPMWSNNRGNHTWVEIWDGDWHFAGAAEPDPKGLDRGWFVGDAAQAQSDSPQHAIYAGSFRKTGINFPLAWARGANYVGAVNVTDRYTANAKPAEPGRLQLRVKVLDHPNGQRIPAKVVVTDSADRAVRLEGTSKDETADMNDALTFALVKQHQYNIEVARSGEPVRQAYLAGTNAQDVVVICLSGGAEAAPGPGANHTPSPASKP